MQRGSHIKPSGSLPQSDNPWAHPGDNAERAKGWKIDHHWLYCSYEQFMRYLVKREAKLAKGKEHQS